MRHVMWITVVWALTTNAWSPSVAWGQLGVPVSDPEALNSNAALDAGNDRYAGVTGDGAGRWVAVWDSNDDLGGTVGGDADILVARSTDNGATWSAPAALNTNADSDSEDDLRPQVATDGAGHWVAVWDSEEDLGGAVGTDLDILVSVSADHGATWSAPAALNTNAAADTGNDLHPRVITDRAGRWLAVWSSRDPLGGTIGDDADILVARSTDNGGTWTAPAALNTNADSDTGNDFIPRVATDEAGQWMAVWYSFDTLGGTIGSDGDILVSRSTDNGASWSAPAALNTTAAPGDAPDHWPYIATDRAGQWVAAWYSHDDLGGTIGLADADILFSRSTDNGLTWSDPLPLNTNAAIDGRSDYYAVIAADGAGNWVTVWYSYDALDGTIGIDADILAARSTDGGVTWSAPATLNTNAATDSGDDLVPQVATDRAGQWVAVWHSVEDLDGLLGSDADILLARFVMPDCNANGVSDAQDIAGGTSEDVNGNGVPDECEIDGVAEICDDGIDNDGDGLIDMDDPDCACGTGACGAGGMMAGVLGVWSLCGFKIHRRRRNRRRAAHR